MSLKVIETGAIHKTRMNGLSCGEESMTICSVVLIQSGETEIHCSLCRCEYCNVVFNVVFMSVMHLFYHSLAIC